jgi:alcohol dehydrogenase
MKHMDDIAARGALLQSLEAWTERMGLQRLGVFGVGVADLPHIIANCRGSSMKTNPVVLSDNDVGNILQARL